MLLVSYHQDDLRLWFTPKIADPFFFAGFILAMFLFTVEIFVNSMVVDGFKYSFFFWLDIIATLSLIPDIQWVMDILSILFQQTPSCERVDVEPGQVCAKLF